MINRYKDYEHKNLFRLLRSQLPADKRHEDAILSVLYIMSSNNEVKCILHDHIKWDQGMLDLESLSTKIQIDEKQRSLINIIIKLYKKFENINVEDLLRLDQVNLEICTTAIYWRVLGFEVFFNDTYSRETFKLETGDGYN